MNQKIRKTALLMSALALMGLCYSPNANAAVNAIDGVQQSTKKVTGTVSDAQGPVIGATVAEKGNTSNAVITDIDGNFSINVKPGATLVISYIGYTTQEIAVGNQSVLNVTLAEDSESLDEVVVIGYGVQKKKLVTGATVQVKGDEIAKLNTTNALEAMQSSTPGVQITQSSSQPGKGYKVYIRGMGTMGDNTPLYVIDGVAGGNLDGINPNDIESIDILKDAASAAIYGSRAANGVILVTTKQGKAGKIEISYNGAIGWSNVYKRPQLLNAQQYMTIFDEYNFNSNGAKIDWTGYVPQAILDKVANGWEGTDWWDVFTNKNALQNNHSVTLTGGNDMSKFSMSYTYTGNEGIMGADKASYYKRHTIRLNSDHVLLKAKDFDAITIGENISIGYNRSHDLAEDGMYWSYIHSLLQVSPLMPQYADNGDIYNYQDPAGNLTYGKGWNASMFNNPWENLEKGGWNSMAESRNFNASATAFAVIQPIKGLRFRSQFNYNWGSGAYRNYSEPRADNAINPVSTYGVSQNAWLNTNWSVENTLTYDLPIISGHKISAMVGQSFQSTAWSVNIGGNNSVAWGDQLATLKGWDSAYLSNIKLADATVASITGSPNDEEYLASWFGRVTWDWNETYMATVTLRHDGSSIFNDGKRWGTFPSASVGWVVTNEKFMESTKSWMNFFKIRASWGQNGNNRISKYQYLATIALSGDANDSGYKFGSDMATSTAGIPHTGAYANIVPNPELTWETSEQLDFGFDARFLNSRLGVNFDWYKKTTKDWLVAGRMVGIMGTSPAMINGGDVRNTGIELAVSWNDRIGKDFSYNVGVNFATNKNKVVRIDNENHYIAGAGNLLSQGTDYVSRAEEGYPIGYFYGMSYSGIWQNQAQIDQARADGKAVLDDAKPGDCIWDDWNGDGVIVGKGEGAGTDKHQIGNPNPDVTLGVNLGLTWKGLDFSVNGAGAFGHQIMRSYRSFGDDPDENYDTTILNRWHGEGTSNDQPRLSNNGHPNTVWVSTRYMENGDYFKIKTVTLGYDFKNVWKGCPFQQLRFYVQAQNLFTFTGYTGLDPEVGSTGGGNSWESGIDLGLYPPARTYLVGASIKF